MRFFFLILFFLIFANCSKQKTVLICGDHVCVNKLEAQQYFEENLTIEVKVINKEKERKIDLVELNLEKNDEKNKVVKVFSKKQTDKKLKILYTNEINDIKKKTKVKKKNKVVKKNNIKEKKIKKKQKKIKKKLIEDKDEIVDICEIVEKCNISEITKYLIDHQNKKFPDITLRQ